MGMMDWLTPSLTLANPVRALWSSAAYSPVVPDPPTQVHTLPVFWGRKYARVRHDMGLCMN